MDGDARPTNVTETLVATGAIVPGAFLAPSSACLGWSADGAVTELYSLHYRALVRLAALLEQAPPSQPAAAPAPTGTRMTRALVLVMLAIRVIRDVFSRRR